MQRSDAVAAAVQRFYDAFSAQDLGAFDAAIASDPDAFVIGTQRWGSGRDAWVGSLKEVIDAGMSLGMEGGEIRGYAQGSLGWAVDTPAFVLPNGMRLTCRATYVATEEDGEWKLLHMHGSWCVPDEVAMQHLPAWQEQLGQVPA
jgi:ketosteroid isomerase-like protein